MQNRNWAYYTLHFPTLWGHFQSAYLNYKKSTKINTKNGTKN